MKKKERKKYHRIRKRSSINSLYTYFALSKKRKISLFVVINSITRKRYEIDMNCWITSPHTKPFSADSRFVSKCASSVKESRHIGNMTIRGRRGHWQKCQDSYIDRSISLIEWIYNNCNPAIFERFISFSKLPLSFQTTIEITIFISQTRAKKKNSFPLSSSLLRCLKFNLDRYLHRVHYSKWSRVFYLHFYRVSFKCFVTFSRVE